MKNPVSKNMNKFNKPATHIDKKKESKIRGTYEFDDVFVEDPNDDESMIFNIPSEYSNLKNGEAIEITNGNSQITITKVGNSKLHIEARKHKNED